MPSSSLEGGKRDESRDNPDESTDDVDREQRHTACLSVGPATPLTSSQSASATSNTSIGNHTIHVIDDAQLTAAPKNPARWTMRIATSATEAATPSHASGTGIMRPRRRSQANSVLPTAKKSAPASPGIASMTRHVSASMARSGSCVRVIAYSVTPSTRAEKDVTTERTAVACGR